MPAIVLLLAGVTGVSCYVGVSAAKHHNLEVATEGMRNLFRMMVMTRKWNADHGGVYVLVDGDTQPNEYLEHKYRDIRDGAGRALTMVNPAFMTREIAALASDADHVYIHLTSLRPIRPGNKPDDWERAALERFERGENEALSVEMSANRESLRFMAPLLVTQGCLACHEKHGYKLGDVRGGISVSVNYSPIELAVGNDARALVLTHLMFFLVSAALSMVLLELLRHRWVALDDTIDKLRRTQKELVSSEKMASLGRMVAGFAHELNTPMGVALSAITHGQESVDDLGRLLGRDEVEEEDLRKPIETIRESQGLALTNLRRSADLVLRFKRTSIDRGSAERRSFCVSQLIGDVLASLRNTLKHLPIEIQVECPPDLTVYGTPGLFDQIFINLVMNSVHHGFDDGARSGRIRIEVAPSKAEGLLHIHYSDDGKGVAREVIGKMFEPFVTTRRSKGGSGLGMFVVYNIVNADLGGNIRCESTLGQGVHFYLDIPWTFQSSPITPDAAEAVKGGRGP